MLTRTEDLVNTGLAAINETYRTGDMGPWRQHVKQLCDADIVLEAPAGAFTEGEWRGHDGVVDFVANQMEVLEDMWLRVDDVMEIGADWLVAEVTFGGRARYTGLAVDLHPFHVWRMRDGRVVQWQIFLEREQALAAAGSGA